LNEKKKATWQRRSRGPSSTGKIKRFGQPLNKKKGGREADKKVIACHAKRKEGEQLFVIPTTNRQEKKTQKNVKLQQHPCQKKKKKKKTKKIRKGKIEGGKRGWG